MELDLRLKGGYGVGSKVIRWLWSWILIDHCIFYKAFDFLSKMFVITELF
jgi:hypothetical protein